MDKKELNKLISEAVAKGFKTAGSSKTGKVVKISKTTLAEAVRKATKKYLAEGMKGTTIVGWAGDGAAWCTDHMDKEKAARHGFQPVFATEEGWEEMTCDTHDPDYADVGGNRLGIHTLGQVAGVSEMGMPGGAMPAAGHGAVAGSAAPTQEAKHGSRTWGTLPSPEELQQAVDELGGWTMNLNSNDQRAFDKALRAAGVSTMVDLDTGEGLHAVISALSDSGDDRAMDLASSMMDILGWEWV